MLPKDITRGLIGKCIKPNFYPCDFNFVLLKKSSYRIIQILFIFAKIHLSTYMILRPEKYGHNKDYFLFLF